MLDQSFQSCNYRLTVFNGSDNSQYILISAYILLSFFTLFQMCRLCGKVFSYHKFHIHEAYRFYTIAFISSIFIIIHRVTQLKLNQKERGDDEDSLQTIYDNNTIYGYRIINELMGVISISVTNMMYLVIGFTWLNIALGCDFNSKSQDVADTFKSIDQQPISLIRNTLAIESQKQAVKNRIKFGKYISFYFLYPFFLIFVVFATLQRSHTICQWSLVILLISTQLEYFLLTYSFIIYLKKRFRDIETPLYTKVILIYLIIAMTLRCVWFNLIVVQGTQEHQNEVFQIVYNIIISVVPILCLSWLSEKQLTKQGFDLIRTQRVMLMQSTII